MNFQSFWNKTANRSFVDRWNGPILAILETLRQRSHEFHSKNNANSGIITIKG